jgi:putative transposase
MRYPASEKLEIIRTVEGSHLPTKQTLDTLGIPRSTFYRWYDLYLEDGINGLSDKTFNVTMGAADLTSDVPV